MSRMTRQTVFFLECNYPFINNTMFINVPAVASARLLSLGWLPRVPLIKSLTRRANSNMQAKERLYRQGDCVIKNEQMTKKYSPGYRRHPHYNC